MTLDYYVDFVAHPIDLNLWEAELYFAAIPVQQLIGNLVYYSNHGRYEPRLAHKWERRDPKTWVFYLRDDVTCENGEKITANSFKKSLERSLYILSKKGGSPVLNGLVGYDQFIKTNNGNDVFSLAPLEGIRVEENSLIFEFSKSTRSGVVQILSFAPYGYICADNLSKNGEWKDREKFVSSGSYQVDNIDLGRTITLSKRPEFKINSKSRAPKKVVFHQVPREDFSKLVNSSASVIDAGSPLKESPTGFKRFDLVKEYLSSIVLGNLQAGVFSSLEARRKLGAAIQEAKVEYANLHKITSFSNSIYPSQTSKVTLDLEEPKYNFTGKKVLIRGGEPTLKSDSYISWQILKRALELVDLEFEFSKSTLTRSDITDQSYDIRLANPSVGGGVEAWIVDVLFCSKLNSNLPDPSGEICRSLQMFEDDLVNDGDFAANVLNIIQRDAAIFPIRHFGLSLYLSSTIDEDSISPLFSIMRFDQIEIADE